jgi:UDP-GlcNAc3NAcA epimerase
MLNIITIIGARPQIIKAAALSRIIHTEFNNSIREEILHTGQHYDHNMSQIFFEEMNIPKPDYQLNINTELQGDQCAQMISGIEKILLAKKPDIVIVYGDTNSTLAAAIVANKLQIPIAHIEAGLRSYNKNMPEELNRIYCDFASTLLFCPTELAIDNLKKENISHSTTSAFNINNKAVYLSGDIMYDNALYYSKIAENKSEIINQLELKTARYLLCTIHRNYNTDNSERLCSIFNGLSSISKQYNIEIILPIHPRTANIISKNIQLQQLLSNNKLLRIIDAVSYFDMIKLQQNSQMILTDSGGLQKEAYFFRKPCIILRSETEWKELLNSGNAIIADANSDLILKAYESFIHNETNISYQPLYGDGNAARFICNILKNNI